MNTGAIAKSLKSAGLDSHRIKAIERVVFSGPGYEERELRRPLWTGEQRLDVGAEEGYLPVQ